MLPTIFKSCDNIEAGGLGFAMGIVDDVFSGSPDLEASGAF
jgi:hypothetical protein